MGKGKPKNPTGWEFSIYAKLKQITKGRKLTPYKAWLQLTEHKNFLDLMLPHFEKQKGYTYKKVELKIKDPDCFLLAFRLFQKKINLSGS